MHDVLRQEIEYLEKIQKLEEYFRGKKVAMISLSESFDNKRGNYLDYIVRSICFTGIDLTVWNPRFKEVLREDEIHRMIRNNMSFEEAKKFHEPKRCIFRSKENMQGGIGIKDLIKSSDEVNVFYSSDFVKSKREQNFNYIFSLNPNAKIFQLTHAMYPYEQYKLERFAIKNGVCNINLELIKKYYEELTPKIAHSCVESLYDKHILSKLKRI